MESIFKGHLLSEIRLKMYGRLTGSAVRVVWCELDGRMIPAK